MHHFSNQLGQFVMVKEFSNVKSFVLDIKNIPPALYYLRIDNLGKKEFSTKIVIE